LTKCSRTNPRTAGIVDIDEGALVMREPDDGLDCSERKQVIGHSEPRQHADFVGQRT